MIKTFWFFAVNFFHFVVIKSLDPDPQPCFDELLAAEHEFLYLAKHRT
jgi:hypothetical protein